MIIRAVTAVDLETCMAVGNLTTVSRDVIKNLDYSNGIE